MQETYDFYVIYEKYSQYMYITSLKLIKLNSMKIKKNSEKLHFITNYYYYRHHQWINSGSTKLIILRSIANCKKTYCLYLAETIGNV